MDRVIAVNIIKAACTNFLAAMSPEQFSSFGHMMSQASSGARKPVKPKQSTLF
jgi:hypothetical protein